MGEADDALTEAELAREADDRRQNSWSIWHAWERRTAPGALRTALRASRQAVNRQAAGG